MDKFIYLILVSELIANCSASLDSSPVISEENLALKGTVTQSSTFYGWQAQHAIDGVRYGLASGFDTGTFCAATSYESNPWWRLDLLNIYNISTVIITAYAYGNYLTQTNGAEIRIGNSLENNGNNNPICAVMPNPIGYRNTISYSCGVMEGRYVNVFIPGYASQITLCEVEVYGTENFAFVGMPTQVSTHSTWIAQRAIDGERYGDALTTCSSTNIETSPWWRLDLLNIVKIKTVVISTRPDCCEDQTNRAEIRIGNSLDNNGNNNPICAVISGFLAGYTNSYSCNGMEGRYLNLIIPGWTTNLTIGEVEVYGTENLALNGTATQSSIYTTRAAEQAIDGVRYGLDLDTAFYCSSTSIESNPWWRLDLLEYYDISTVIITARSESDTRLDQTSGAEIRIGNSLENNGNNNSICAVTSVPLTGYTVSYSCGVMEGRYVNVIMSGRTTRLTLCEVEVYGKQRMRKTFLRLNLSSSGDVAAESDKILHQLQSALALYISDFKLSWIQLPKKEEEKYADKGSCVKHH